MSSDPPAIVFALREQLLRDLTEGTVRSLGEYQRRFEGYEEVVAREFARMQQGEEEFVPPPTSPQRLGRYRIVRELGRGGQATVYLAEDERLARRVAIKVLRGWTGGALTLRERFRREAVVTSRLEHPGICPVYEADEADGVPFVVMRYVEGFTLTRAMDGADPGAADREHVLERVLVIEKVARALHAAHLAGVVHRDVKPGNIILRADGQPVLLDFGLARDLDDASPTLTATGDVFGTPSYMAPEQIDPRGRSVGPATDVYSLGATAYEYITGTRPFQAETREVLFRAILTSEPKPVSARAPSAPRDLDVVIATAMTKEPELRYPSAGAFADDLRAVVESRPVTATPPSLVTKGLRFARREPTKTALFAMAAIALVSSLCLVVYLASTSREIEAGREEMRRRELQQLVLGSFGGFGGHGGHPSVDGLRAILDEEPDAVMARLTLALSYLQAGIATSALEVLDHRQADLASQSALERVRVAALRRVGRTDEADDVEGRLPAARFAVEHYALGKVAELGRGDDDYAAAAVHLQRAVLTSSRAEPIYHLSWVKALYSSGQYDDALEASESAVLLWPESGLAWFLNGSILGVLGELARAEEAFSKAVEYSPEAGMLWLMLGATRLEIGDPDGAEVAYRRAIAAAEPDGAGGQARLHSMWGMSLVHAGRAEPAIAAFRAALAADPSRDPDRRRLVDVLFELERYADLIEPVGELLSWVPGDVDRWWQLAVAQERLGRPSEAAEAAARGLEAIKAGDAVTPARREELLRIKAGRQDG